MLGSGCADWAAGDHVVDVCSLAEAVAAGEGVVGEAAGGGDVQPGLAAEAGEIGGVDEALPVVGAFGYEAEQVFGGDDGLGVGFGGAAEGGEKEAAARLDQFGAGGNHGGGVGHVFEHFHAGNHVVGSRLLGGERFHADAAVVQVGQALLFGMGLGYLKGFFGHVDAGGLRGFAGKGFAEDAAAAAHVEHVFAGQPAAMFADETQSQRVDFMKGFKFALGIPPLGG